MATEFRPSSIDRLILLGSAGAIKVSALNRMSLIARPGETTAAQSIRMILRSGTILPTQVWAMSARRLVLLAPSGAIAMRQIVRMALGGTASAAANDGFCSIIW